MKINFVSDVTCPWCAIGLTALEQAISRVAPPRRIDLNLEPFVLNPDIPREGEEILHYAQRKYGTTAEQLARRHVLIRARGTAVGFHFGLRTRIWSSFDAQRLLHWAALEGRALPLKHALLVAYHTRGENIASHAVLALAASQVGLDIERARAVLAGEVYADVVRERVAHWSALGIRSVPTVIVDERIVIEGGQSVDAFEQALRAAANSRSSTAS